MRKKAVDNLVEIVDKSAALEAVKKAFKDSGLDIGTLQGVILCFELPVEGASVALSYHYGRTVEFMENQVNHMQYAPGERDPGFHEKHREQLERYWVEANG